MSVLITGIEMPKEGDLLCINIHPNGKVCMFFDLDCKQVATAIPVPPYGGLINREYAIATACSGRIRALPTTEDGEDWMRVEEVRESIKNAPTVIPAEEGGDGDG